MKQFSVGQELAAQNRVFAGPETYKRVVKITRINLAGNLRIGTFDGVDPKGIGRDRYFSDHPDDIAEARKCGEKYNLTKRKNTKQQAASMRLKAERLMKEAQQIIERANELDPIEVK